MFVKHFITPETYATRGGITALEIEVSSELGDRIIFHMKASIGGNFQDVKFSMGKNELKRIIDYTK